MMMMKDILLDFRKKIEARANSRSNEIEVKSTDERKTSKLQNGSETRGPSNPILKIHSGTLRHSFSVLFDSNLQK